jgi:hypothetical protein
MKHATPLLLRSIALLIAAAAVVDPVFTTSRRSDAVVAVIPADAADSALARALVQRVGGRFHAVAGSWPGAAATVVAGSSVPGGIEADAPVFAVLPPAPPIRIAALRYAARVPPDALAAVAADVDVKQAGAVQARLLRDGVVLDAVDTVMAAPGSLAVVLSFAPAEPGFARLRLEARTAAGDVAARDAVVDVAPQRWRVLFHDGRPSWLSTFVRRTLEQDARFAVSARVETSRGIATDFGGAVPRLSDDGGLGAFDVVVVGAPETLDAAALSGLERFMRRRGGSVLLLPDRVPEGAWIRLAGAASWQGTDGAAVARLHDAAGAGPLRTGARAWPAPLPAGARTLLTDDHDRPVLWRTTIGAGALVVSGALDSWQFRDPETSDFENYWPALLAGLAGAAPAALHAEVPGVATAGEWTALRVTLRDMVPGAHVAATLEDGTPLELWPGAEPGELRAEFRAPAGPGEYMILVEGDDDVLRVPLYVDARPEAALPDDRDILAALAGASGGAVLDAAAAADLPLLLQQALRPERAPQPWRPMQSPWWILPFVAALGGEWYWRRRRALP